MDMAYWRAAITEEGLKSLVSSDEPIPLPHESTQAPIQSHETDTSSGTTSATSNTENNDNVQS